MAEGSGEITVVGFNETNGTSEGINENAPDTEQIFRDHRRRGLAEAPFGLGKRRTLSDLQKKEYVFIAVALTSLLATLILTIYKLATVSKSSSDFTFAVVLLLSTVFCLWYLVEGVLFERPYEIIVLSISSTVVWFYIILNFAVGSKDIVKMIRLIITSILGPIVTVMGVLIAKHYFDSGRLIFRTVGAQTLMQEMCKTMFGFFGMLKFDLQLSLSLVILIMTGGRNLSHGEVVIIAVGIPFAIVCVLLGYINVRYEIKFLAIFYCCTLLAQPVYAVYIIVQSIQLYDNTTDSLGIPTMVCAGVTLLIHVVLVTYFVRAWLNFGKGLKEKVYGKVKEPQRPRAPKEPQNPTVQA